MLRVIFVSFFALIISLASLSQTLTDDQRRQAERELQRASPGEIQERLRQAGISQEEAVRRARAEGISLEDYLFPVTPAEDIDTDAEERLAPHRVDISREADREPETEAPTRYQPTEFKDRETAKDLDAFAYSIFQFPASTFEPVLNIPPPPNYRLGPGDELIITVWGQVQVYHALTVNRHGYIMVPDVGQVMANGLTLDEMKSRLLQRMTQVYSSLDEGRPEARSHLELSIGKLRTVQVFILGDVKRPGGYTLSSMSTAFKALYYSGGPSLKGSMRNIKVLRGNQEIAVIDFYEYALRGDQSKDERLEDGDIIFVPPAKHRVAIAGGVVRPAIYELQQGESLGDLVEMAGGLRFNAYIDRLHVERIIPFAQRREHRFNVLDIDLRFEEANDILTSDYTMEAGDVVTVFSQDKRLENRVRLVGNVFKPGIFELRGDMRVWDLVEQGGGLLDDTFADRGTLIRTRESDLRREIKRFDLRSAMQGDPDHNLELKRLDEIYIYSTEYFFPQHTVTIAGNVKNPGTYTRAEGMTVEDLLVLAGGINEEAMLSEITVSRIDTSSDRAYTETYRPVVSEDYWNVSDNPARFYLDDFDHVKVPADPRRSKQRYVHIEGEVRYPGRYAILDDEERLSSIVERAGGLKESAYTRGARYFRVVEGDRRLLPTSIHRALANNESADNIIVRDHDEIRIPSDPGVVVVRGSVNVPVAVKYEEGKSKRYYINQAGGYAENADKGRTTVTLPNGSMWESSGWFFIPNDEILAGSVINVPEKAPRDGRTMEILRDWTTLMASTAAIIVGIVQITK